ncbi:MAG: hypothetical protein JWO03_2283 [Bacteroidetes bacterium]|nr:hypothetical protein [Bacteroidota bacterium]
MLIQHIAIIDRTGNIDPATLAQTAAALQKQATRDLGPIWGVKAIISAFPDLASVPVGYAPVIIMDQLDRPDLQGYHLDDNNQPYSLVLYGDSWQLTCSHEICEILVDPSGNKTVTSGSKDPAQGRVQYLVEVSDPCQDISFGYSVNGIWLSDFYTPNYFDPVTAPGVRYSFTGAITEPLQVLQNGYLTWFNPDDGQWCQMKFFGDAPEIVKVEGMEAITGAIRCKIDRLTQNTHKKTLKRIHHKHITAIHSGEARARRWEQELKKHWTG